MTKKVGGLSPTVKGALIFLGALVVVAMGQAAFWLRASRRSG